MHELETEIEKKRDAYNAVVKKYRQASGYAARRGCSKVQDREDFRGFVAERILRGRKATMEQLFCDFVRENLGRGRFNALGFSRGWKRFESLSGREISESGDGTSGDYQKLLGALSRIKGKGIPRAIVVLAAEWGLSGREIAHCFGVDPSRISQRLKDVRSCLAKTSKQISVSLPIDLGISRKSPTECFRLQENASISCLAEGLLLEEPGEVAGELQGLLLEDVAGDEGFPFESRLFVCEEF